MKKTGFLLRIITMILVAGLFSHAAWADTTEYADLGKAVSLTLHLESVEEEVKIEEGAEVCIYQIAKMEYQASDLKFVYTEDWKGMTADLGKETPEDVILSMSRYAEEKDLTGQTGRSDANGNVRFTDLPQGVYLVAQKNQVEHFTSFAPFLVYLPSLEEEKWSYDVTATPKIVYQVQSGSRDREKTPAPSPTTPPKEESTKRDTPNKLPQTGQLNWPIPILFVLGAFLVSAGVIVRLSGRKEDEEKR